MSLVSAHQLGAALCAVGLLVGANGCATTTAPSATTADASAPDLAAHAALEPLAWLAGTWVSERAPDLAGGAEWTEETWTAPAGNVMLGVNRSMAGPTMAFFEFLRLQVMTDGSVVYFAAPAGRHPPAPFPLTEVTADRLVFENPDHDFPQRIMYARQPDGTLTMTISAINPAAGDRTMTWTMVRAAE